MPLRCENCAGTHLARYDCSFEMEGFDAFWEAYPKHRDKITAKRTWRRLCGPIHLDAILKGINRYMASGEWKDPQFIPYPATFLNGRRWEDEIGNTASKAEVNLGFPRYCATCGHTGSWHKNELHHGRNPGHEFVLASDTQDVAEPSGSMAQGRV